LLRTVVSESGESLSSSPHKLFSETDEGDWSTTRFRRHYQNQVLTGRDSDVLLSYADGSAAVTFSGVGKGAVVFVNLPLTPDGGDFIGSPMFPATIHELLRELRRSSEGREVTPGTTWVLETATKGEGALTVLDPDGAVLETQLLASGRTSRLALPSTRAPGIYLVKQGGVVVGAEAVNVDSRESDTRPIPLEKIKSAAGSAVTVVRDEDDLLLAGKARPLWPQMAAATTALLALEMLLLGLWRTSPKTARDLAKSVHASGRQGQSPPGSFSARRQMEETKR
jgi:hypothetical protein